VQRSRYTFDKCFVVLKRTVFFFVIYTICQPKSNKLSAFAANATGKLDVLWHDGDAFRVDGAQVGVLEEAHQVRLAGLLKRHHGRALESQVGLEILRDFSHQTLEGQLADQKFRALLVTSNLAESHCAGPVAMGFLHASRGRCTLASRLGSQLLPWSFASGGFTCGLLGTRHVC
jgi:hypothetical protein